LRKNVINPIVLLLFYFFLEGARYKFAGK